MAEAQINPEQFIQQVQPLLESSDLPGLMRCIKDHWTPTQIISLFNDSNVDARKIAALVLGFVGERASIEPLASQLRDCDPMLNRMAEHSLWSIWFRCGCTTANQELLKGSRSLDDRDFDLAIHHFSRAIQIDPTFAEAYNQRALANYLKEDFEPSIADCNKVIELMPLHFGAWAGLGHCYAHTDQIDQAINAYTRALEINPHLDCIQEALAELRKRSEEKK